VSSLINRKERRRYLCGLLYEVHPFQTWRRCSSAASLCEVSNRRQKHVHKYSAHDASRRQQKLQEIGPDFFLLQPSDCCCRHLHPPSGPPPSPNFRLHLCHSQHHGLEGHTQYEQRTRTRIMAQQWFGTARGDSLGSVRLPDAHSPEGLVSTATGYGLHRRGSIPGRGKRFSSFSHRPDRLWSPPRLLYNGYPGGKAAGA
jgi:hypothetical protein